MINRYKAIAGEEDLTLHQIVIPIRESTGMGSDETYALVLPIAKRLGLDICTKHSATQLKGRDEIELKKILAVEHGITYDFEY